MSNDTTKGDSFDMNAAPSLGQGQVPPREYRCFIMEMSDRVAFKSAATTGSCTAGTENTINVCQNGIPTTSVNGITTTCTAGEDNMFVYVSPYSTATGGAGSTANPLIPPQFPGDSTRGIILQNVIDITSGAGTFVFDTSQAIDGSGGTCDMQPPKFGFRNG